MKSCTSAFSVSSPIAANAALQERLGSVRSRAARPPLPAAPSPAPLASPRLASPRSRCPGGGRFPLPVPAPGLGWPSPAPPRRASGWEGRHLSPCLPEPEGARGSGRMSHLLAPWSWAKRASRATWLAVQTWVLNGRQIGQGDVQTAARSRSTWEVRNRKACFHCLLLYVFGTCSSELSWC